MYKTKPTAPQVLPILFKKNINPKIITVTNNINRRSSDPIIDGILKFPKNDDTPNTPKTL